MNIYVLSDAEEDLQQGRQFYEQQELQVGAYFWDSLISDIESLSIYASVHAKQFGYYRMSSKRFPFSIYYDVKGDDIYVIAVLPEKREPSWILNHLNPSSDV